MQRPGATYRLRDRSGGHGRMSRGGSGRGGVHRAEQRRQVQFGEHADQPQVLGVHQQNAGKDPAVQLLRGQRQARARASDPLRRRRPRDEGSRFLLHGRPPGVRLREGPAATAAAVVGLHGRVPDGERNPASRIPPHRRPPRSHRRGLQDHAQGGRHRAGRERPTKEQRQVRDTPDEGGQERQGGEFGKEPGEGHGGGADQAGGRDGRERGGVRPGRGDERGDEAGEERGLEVPEARGRVVRRDGRERRTLRRVSLWSLQVLRRLAIPIDRCCRSIALPGSG
mmetsp:Transcript_44402/g.94511  ORF Transcript_44402/g.94511 Transcript_44402/m.94511 type:complete len:282 (-) Transcript_44402:129-974(-)